MAIVPEFPIVDIRDETQIPNRTYKLDFDRKRIVGYVDDEEAIQQAAKKILYTPRFDCYAYDDQYGSEVVKLLKDENATREYVEAEMEFLISDALCADGRFGGIENLQFGFKGDEASISFIVDTTLGKIKMEGATENVRKQNL